MLRMYGVMDVVHKILFRFLPLPFASHLTFPTGNSSFKTHYGHIIYSLKVCSSFSPKDKQEVMFMLSQHLTEILNMIFTVLNCHRLFMGI